MSHINLECSTGMVLICLFQMGSGYCLSGVDGDLDLPLLLDADPELLLLGLTLLSIISKRGSRSFSRSPSGFWTIHTNFGPLLG